MEKRTNGKKIWRKYLLLGLFFCFLFLPSYESKAAPASGTVRNRILNVRTTASTSSAIVCKLTQGTTVTISSETTGTDGMKWYKVSFAKTGGATEGYVRGDLLNVSGGTSGDTTGSSSGQSAPATKDGDTVYVNASAVRVRESASESSKIIANLLKGDSGEQIKTKKGDDGKYWTKVSFTINDTKYKGYIRSDLLTSANPGGTSDSSDDEILYVSASAVRVRDSASTSGKLIANLLQGDQVKLKKTKTGDDGKQWSKVSFTINDTKYQGYIRSDLLSASKSGSSSTGSDTADTGSDDEILYVKGSSVRVREEASTSSAIVAGLQKGAQVKQKKTKTGTDGKQWTKVSFTYNGTKTYGYIRSDLLTGTGNSTSTSSGSQTSTASSKKIRVSAANVRSTASVSGSIKATMVQGSSVSVLSETTGTDGKKWSKISGTYNGKTVEGYIRSDLLN